jgi:hypothetical protein
VRRVTIFASRLVLFVCRCCFGKSADVTSRFVSSLVRCYAVHDKLVQIRAPISASCRLRLELLCRSCVSCASNPLPCRLQSIADGRAKPARDEIVAQRSCLPQRRNNHHIIGLLSSSTWARRHPKGPPAALRRSPAQRRRQQPRRRTIRRPRSWRTKTSGQRLLHLSLPSPQLTATTAAAVAVPCTKRTERIRSIPLRLGRRDFRTVRRETSHYWMVLLLPVLPLPIHNHHRTIRNITCMDNGSIRPIKCRRNRINNQHRVNKSRCRRHGSQVPSPRYAVVVSYRRLHFCRIIQCFRFKTPAEQWPLATRANA